MAKLYPPVIDESQICFVKGDTNSAFLLNFDFYIQNLISGYVLIQAIDPKTGESLLCNSSGQVLNLQICAIKRVDGDNQKYSFDTTTTDTYPPYLKAESRQVQVNMMCLNIENIDSDLLNQDALNWYNNNRDKASVTSKAVIFNFIDKEPQINIKTPSLSSKKEGVVSLKEKLRITASIDNLDMDNFLVKYQILINKNSEVVFSSDWQYPKNQNELDYQFENNLQFEPPYSITIFYTTKKGYISSSTFQIIAFEELQNKDSSPLVEYFSLTTKFKNNRNLEISCKGKLLGYGAGESYSLLIFKDYDFIQEISISISDLNEKDLSFTFLIDNISFPKINEKYNFTFLILEHYSSQYEYLKNYELYVQSKDQIILDTPTEEYVIKYNPDLTGYKYNIVDTITPTLGGAYPFIRRNGHQRYRTFNISGLISCVDMDDGVELTNYGGYEDQLFVERQYRDRILKFLHADDIKLFRSNQEGAMFVRLTNISLTPNKQLDRRIYSFSATATEVAEYSDENLRKYGFIE